MKAIGGYFELEDEDVGLFPHESGILLNTGRNALEYILRSLKDVKHIYLPYFTCEVVLEPIKKLNISYSYYHINDEFEIADEITLDAGEYIIANNYFGIKDAYIENLAHKYGDQLIVDCAQAFFAPVLPRIKMFYSIRKFIGVPDGGVAYGAKFVEPRSINIDDSSSRLDHLKIRKELGAEAGFKIYQENESKLDNQDIRLMSNYTRNVVQHIDFDKIIEKRKANYLYIEKSIGYANKLVLPEMDRFVCPMVYPFMTDDCDLRNRLISNKIFVARYWPNVIPYLDFVEDVQISKMLLPLPIDQRYCSTDLDRIIKIINS